MGVSPVPGAHLIPCTALTVPFSSVQVGMTCVLQATLVSFPKCGSCQCILEQLGRFLVAFRLPTALFAHRSLRDRVLCPAELLFPSFVLTFLPPTPPPPSVILQLPGCGVTVALQTHASINCIPAGVQVFSRLLSPGLGSVPREDTGNSQFPEHALSLLSRPPPHPSHTLSCFCSRIVAGLVLKQCLM